MGTVVRVVVLEVMAGGKMECRHSDSFRVWYLGVANVSVVELRLVDRHFKPHLFKYKAVP